MKLLRFYADWCEPCKRVAPIVEAMSSRYSISVESVNVDEGRFPADGTADLLEKYSVKTVPMFVVLDNDGDTVFQGTGIESVPALSRALEAL